MRGGRVQERHEEQNPLAILDEDLRKEWGQLDGEIEDERKPRLMERSAAELFGVVEQLDHLAEGIAALAAVRRAIESRSGGEIRGRAHFRMYSANGVTVVIAGWFDEDCDAAALRYVGGGDTAVTTFPPDLDVGVQHGNIPAFGDGIFSALHPVATASVENLAQALLLSSDIPVEDRGRPAVVAMLDGQPTAALKEVLEHVEGRRGEEEDRED